MRDKLSDVTESTKILWRGLGGLQVAFWAGQYPDGVVHVPLQVVFSHFRASSRLKVAWWFAVVLWPVCLSSVWGRFVVFLVAAGSILYVFGGCKAAQCFVEKRQLSPV